MIFCTRIISVISNARMTEKQKAGTFQIELNMVIGRVVEILKIHLTRPLNHLDAKRKHRLQGYRRTSGTWRRCWLSEFQCVLILSSLTTLCPNDRSYQAAMCSVNKQHTIDKNTTNADQPRLRRFAPFLQSAIRWPSFHICGAQRTQRILEPWKQPSGVERSVVTLRLILSLPLQC